jgi:hypothetical protein
MRHAPISHVIRVPLRWAVPVIGLLLAGAPAVAQAGDSGLRIELNIPTLRIEAFDGGRLIKTYPVAVGQLGHGTPTGTFRISRAEWNPSWRPPQREWTRGKSYTPPGPDNPMGRVKMFFSPLYYIHGTPDEESLGTPASHGCVRMLNEDAVELATLLHEEASPTIPAEQIDRILAQSRTTRVSRLEDSVTLVIRYDLVVVEDEVLAVYPDIYRRGIHTEAVYQALLAGGYDVSAVTTREVSALLERVRGAARVVRVPLREAFARLPRVGDAEEGRRR